MYHRRSIMKATFGAEVVLCFFLFHNQINGQIPISVDAEVIPREINGDHLELGGSNSMGRSIQVNNYYLSMDGKPVIPVTGEFHFSRYPEEYWEESIRKMRAGGISVIATYVFWNMHEEEEGIFNWEGSRDLRKFVTHCAAHGYDVIVRIGPFCHGEIRNGGLPDWLLGKPLVLRSNDPRYLEYVERLFTQIGLQLEGLLFKDGGPVIGIQLENEYQHSAAPWGLTYPGQPHDWTVAGRDLEVTQMGVGSAEGENPYASLGDEHMKVLKALALKAGIRVPLYTATGWGNAAIIEHGSLPVTAAYPYPTWAPEKPSDFYLYTDLQKDPDYAPVRYHPEEYPYFAAELGGGIMNTYERRPVVPAESLDPMINRFLGSGANGIGYYMYHGGSTPMGQRNYFSDVAVGCPIISYDFQAPIGEFGQVKPSFHRLKLLHLFLNSFGGMLAPMQVILPESQQGMSPDNDSTLRYSLRALGGSGFIFMNNFQDHRQSRDMEDIRFSVRTAKGTLQIPEEGALSLPAGEHAILPFNLNLGETLLLHATTQLVTTGGGPQDPYYLFFALPGMAPEYAIGRSKGVNLEGGPGCRVIRKKDRFLVHCRGDQPVEFTVTSGSGRHTRILTVPRAMAMNAYPVVIRGASHLLFSEALALAGEETIDLISFDRDRIEFALYPATGIVPRIDLGQLSEGDPGDELFSRYSITLPAFHPEVEVERIQYNKFAMRLPGSKPEEVNDLFLRVDYYGDTGMGFVEGALVADHFYNGTAWTIGMKQFTRFQEEREMVLYFRPLYNDAPFLKDLESAGSGFMESIPGGFSLKGVELLPEYRVSLTF